MEHDMTIRSSRTGARLEQELRLGAAGGLPPVTRPDWENGGQLERLYESI